MTVNLKEIISSLNDNASRYRFGKLQETRKARRPLRKSPSRHPFRHTQRDWAHHVGGRHELQFNIGDDAGKFRWCIAMSLQRSRSLLDVTQLYPKLRKMSTLLEAHRDHFQRLGFEMWDWTGGTLDRKRSRNREPQSVTEDLYVPGAFIVIGKQAPWSEFNPDVVLSDFDELLPIYEYVEFESDENPPTLYTKRGFEFEPIRPSRSDRSISTTMTRQSSFVHVSLRHRQLQDALINQLKSEGAEVSREHPDGKGGYIDVVARKGMEIEFYEIKTNATVRLALREAIGQLLEYAYWPIPARPTRLFVAAEHVPDTIDMTYLSTLSTEMSLEINYRQIKLDQ